MEKYDVYGDMQLKVGNCRGNTFSLGDRVPIDNGVYITHTGAVVIADGRLKYCIQNEDIYDKWGKSIDIEEAIEARNPIEKALASIIDRGEKNNE